MKSYRLYSFKNVSEVGKYIWERQDVPDVQWSRDTDNNRAAEKKTNIKLSYESCCRYLGGNNMGQASELWSFIQNLLCESLNPWLLQALLHSTTIQWLSQNIKKGFQILKINYQQNIYLYMGFPCFQYQLWNHS